MCVKTDVFITLNEVRTDVEKHISGPRRWNIFDKAVNTKGNEIKEKQRCNKPPTSRILVLYISTMVWSRERKRAEL